MPCRIVTKRDDFIPRSFHVSPALPRHFAYQSQAPTPGHLLIIRDLTHRMSFPLTAWGSETRAFTSRLRVDQVLTERITVSLGILASALGMWIAPNIAAAQTAAVCRDLAINYHIRDSSAMSQGAESTDSLLRWANAATDRRCPELAVDMWMLGARRQPGAASFWVSYATDVLLTVLHRPDSAIALFERTAAARPNDVDLFEELGALYDQLKRPEAAHCAFVRAVAADSTRVLGWAGLARLAARHGDLRVALGYWARIELINPTYLNVPPIDVGFGIYIPLRPVYIIEDQALYRRAIDGGHDTVAPISAAAVRNEAPACWRRWGWDGSAPAPK